MRFIVDECCHRLIVVALREQGHDVRYASENDSRASDMTIAALAFAEDRIVVTADYDFGELAIRHGRPMPGVLLLAPSGEPISSRTARFVAIVASLDEQLRGTLTIVEDTRLRVRPLNAAALLKTTPVAPPAPEPPPANGR